VITRHQIAFATAMLGGPRGYRGRPLETVHHALAIRAPHFGRRQMLMREVLDEMGLAPELRDAWLAREEQLRPLIMRPGSPSCSK
jgi:truncated hemoglobin YjbI